MGLMALMFLTAAWTLAGALDAQAEPVMDRTSVVAAPARGSAVDDLGACLASRKAADVVFLVDESLSLIQTDPDATRVTAASYLADQWAALNAQTGGTINLSIIGFAQTTEHRLAWTAVTTASRSSVQGALQSLRSRNQGDGTDYWMALDDARRTLTTKPGRQDGDCQAIVWFTDGKLDASATYVLNGRTAHKPYATSTDGDSSALAQMDLCRPGGLADQIRSSGVVTFAIGLQAGSTQASEFDLMKGVATGAPVAGASCGRITAPTPGEFHLASDIDQLLFVFDRLRSPGSLPLDQTLGVCQGKVCASETHRFVLDGSIGRVHVLSSATVSGAEAYLQAPTGTMVKLPRPGQGASVSLDVGSGTVEVTAPSATALSLDLTPRDRGSGWAGAWGLVFVDPKSSSPNGKTRTSLEISADIKPGWTGAPKGPVRAGEESSPVTFDLVTSAGVRIDPATLLGTLSFSAVLVDSAGDSVDVVTDAAKGEVSTSRPLDLTSASAGHATVRVTLALTTAVATLADGHTVPGTALTPQSVDLPLTIEPAAGYPPVSPSALDFGTIETAADVTAALTVRGPGCVWVPADKVEVLGAPEQVGAVQIVTTATSSASCLRVPEGSTARFLVRLITQSAGNGAVTGRFLVDTAPIDEPSRIKTVTATFRANFVKPPDLGLQIGVFALALVVGIGVPIGLLYLVKWRSCRIPPVALLSDLIAVRVTGDQVLRDGSSFQWHLGDLRSLVPIPPGGARRLDVHGARLSTHVGPSPFGAGTVQVSRPGWSAASSTHGVGREGRATLPLAVHYTWVLFRSQDGPEIPEILVLAGGDMSPELKDRVAADIRTRLPGLWQRLSGSISEGSDGNDPFAPDNAGTASGVNDTDPWEPSAPPSTPPRSTPTTPPSSGSSSPDFSSWSFDDPD